MGEQWREERGQRSRMRQAITKERSSVDETAKLSEEDSAHSIHRELSGQE